MQTVVRSRDSDHDTEQWLQCWMQTVVRSRDSDHDTEQWWWNEVVVCGAGG
jgi:hypothetical protein